MGEEITLGILAERVDNLKDELKNELVEVKEQVKKTNGSVASLKVWRGIMTGAISVLTAIVIPLLFMILSSWLNNIKK